VSLDPGFAIKSNERIQNQAGMIKTAFLKEMWSAHWLKGGRESV
jgi:hypothetical protein